MAIEDLANRLELLNQIIEFLLGRVRITEDGITYGLNHWCYLPFHV